MEAAKLNDAEAAQLINSRKVKREKEEDFHDRAFKLSRQMRGSFINVDKSRPVLSRFDVESAMALNLVWLNRVLHEKHRELVATLGGHPIQLDGDAGAGQAPSQQAPQNVEMEAPGANEMKDEAGDAGTGRASGQQAPQNVEMEAPGANEINGEVGEQDIEEEDPFNFKGLGFDDDMNQ